MPMRHRHDYLRTASMVPYIMRKELGVSSWHAVSDKASGRQLKVH
jgi:hypothetical protein